MRHRNKKTILGREAAPRRALLRNLATSVVLYEKVRTTEAKAKTIKPVVERFITKCKLPNLHIRRQLLSYFFDEQAVRKLIDDLGPRYKDRHGGYMRITKLGTRRGDRATLVQLEFVK